MAKVSPNLGLLSTTPLSAVQNGMETGVQKDMVGWHVTYSGQQIECPNDVAKGSIYIYSYRKDWSGTIIVQYNGIIILQVLKTGRPFQM